MRQLLSLGGVAGASAPRRAAVVFILVTVMMDVLSFGIIIPVLPRLVEEFVLGDTSRAAQAYGWMVTTWALMQFVGSPLQGALSDRFGRRPIILLSNTGLGFDYMVMALAPSLSWLFVGRAVSGLVSASFSAAGAYIADVTSPKERAAAFGLIGAAFGLGFILGPAVGGALGAVDPRWPFWGAAAASLINACYGYFVLPESLSRENRMSFSWRRANPVGSLVLLRSHHELFGLAAANFLAALAHVVLPSVTVLYLSYRYGWGTGVIGLTLAAVGVCMMVVQGWLIKPISDRLGERRTLLVGLLSGAVGFAVYGLAPTGPLYWTGIPVMALWGLAGPAAQALMTRRVSASEQGQLQGAIASLMGIAGMVGPVIFAHVFGTVIGPLAEWRLPGAPFLLASLMLLLAMVISSRVTKPNGKVDHNP